MEKITFTMGNPHFRGQKIISVDKAGLVKVIWNMGETNSTWEGKLSQPGLSEFLAKVEAVDVCSLSNNRPGVPGEDLLQFHVVQPDGDCKSEAWSNDQNDSEPLSVVVNAFHALGNEISEGTVPPF